MVSKYGIAYRVGVTPWEQYGTAAAAGIGALLDREEADRSGELGRALDLGCGRGHYTRELARRGWRTVGVDAVPKAVEAARSASGGARFEIGDVTALRAADLGTFGFFLDVGCFQGLTAGQRLAHGRATTALADPGATLLLLAFGPTRLRRVVGGVSPRDVERALPAWGVLSVEPADTAGLGWPLSRTSPQWYRLRLGG